MSRHHVLRRGARRAFAVVAAVATVALASPGGATELLSNGGFESGDFDNGWVLVDNVLNSQVVCPGQPDAFEGDCYAQLGAEGSPSSLQNSVATQPGQTYRVSFAYQSDGNVPNLLSVSFGSAPVFSESDILASNGWLVHSGLIRASDPSTTIEIRSRNDAGYLLLDAVSVTVPEPATLALLALTLTGLALQRRRPV